MKERCYQCIPVGFSGKVYYEACCVGAKKWDTMFFHVNPYY